jgi:hypothetical protein
LEQVALGSQPPPFEHGSELICSGLQKVLPSPVKPPLQAQTTSFSAFNEQVALTLQPPLFVAQGLAGGFCGKRKQPVRTSDRSART